jgi:endonuclease/exonuclease/phosphatase family metal-dependent hydrolase
MFRVVTINLEQDHKRWAVRHKLISAELAALRPDIIAFNEVCVPIQSAKILRDAITSTTGVSYNLVQQTKVNGLSEVEGEALLTPYPLLETGNLDYQTRDMVALVSRVLIDATPVDVYVSHLFKSRGDDSLRLFQVEQLLAWVDSRPDVAASIICGDFDHLRRLQCHGRDAVWREDGIAVSADANDHSNGLHAPLGQRRDDLPSLLAANG